MTLPKSLRLKDGRWAIIRIAGPEDAGNWIANVNGVAAERVYIMTERVSKSIEEVRTQFANADRRRDLWLVAEVEGTLAGGADFHRGARSKNEHVAELGVALQSGFRGVGLGEALILAGIEWSHGEKIRKLKLGVFATNEAAIKLYRKLGFIEEGRLKDEVVLDGKYVDELLMSLRLRD